MKLKLFLMGTGTCSGLDWMQDWMEIGLNLWNGADLGLDWFYIAMDWMEIGLD